MGENLANLDMLSHGKLMMKCIYCHVYQGNSQGRGKLMLYNYSTNNP